MSTEMPEQETTAVVVRARDSVLLTPVMDVGTALSRLHQFQEFVTSYLQPSENGGEDGGDYGIIPGTKKKTLLKSGAEKLCEIYGLYDEYEFIARVEDWDKGLFDYQIKCVLKSRRDDSMVGTGLGSCSSFESKYRWRDSQRKCPKCGVPAIIKGKDFKGTGEPTGWLCFAKKGGCGSKFKDGDPLIEAQVMGRVDNPDIIDTKNTVLKMAKKRAKIDAVIGVTRSSGLFTQDIEDVPTEQSKEATVARMAENIENGRPPEEPDLFRERIPSDLFHEYIDRNMAANFERMFKDSLHPDLRKDALKYAHDWLRVQEIVDREGNPTARAIRKANFFEVREAAILHARSLEPGVYKS